MRRKQVRRSASDEATVEQGVRRWVIKSMAGIAIVAIFLFPAAGTVACMGWALVGVWVVYQASFYLLLRRTNPALLAERAAGPSEDNPRWDTMIMSIVGLLMIAVYVIAGLDRRFGWSAGVGGQAPSRW